MPDGPEGAGPRSGTVLKVPPPPGSAFPNEPKAASERDRRSLPFGCRTKPNPTGSAEHPKGGAGLQKRDRPENSPRNRLPLQAQGSL